jgi:hypothetical protein
MHLKYYLGKSTKVDHKETEWKGYEMDYSGTGNDPLEISCKHVNQIQAPKEVQNFVTH